MFRSRVAEHYRARGYRVREDVTVRGRSGAIHRCDLVAEGSLGALVVSFGDESGFEGPELGSVRRAAQDIGAGAVAAAPVFNAPVHAAARQFGVTLLDEAALDAPDPVVAEESAPEALDHPWPDPEAAPTRRTPPTAPRTAAAATEGNGASALLWKHPRQTGRPPQPDRAEDPTGSVDEAGPGSGLHEDRQTAAPAPVAPVPEHSRRKRNASFAWLNPDTARASPKTVPASPELPIPGRSDASGIRSEPASLADAVANAPGLRSEAATVPARPERIVQVPIRRTTPPAPQPSFPWRWVVGPVLYGLVTGIVLFLFAVFFL